jgi:hypothetical protein
MDESYGSRGYAKPEYAEDGYGGDGYGDDGYAQPGYAQPGYAQPGYADDGFPDRGYPQRDRGYPERDRGYPERDRRYPERDRGKARGNKKRTGAEHTRAGGVIVALLSLLCTFLVLWGLYYASGTGERHRVALAASGCEPNLSPDTNTCTTVFMLNNQYRRLVNPAIQQVNTAMADYAANETQSLAAAEAALRAAATTENAFHKSLTQFRFPPSVAPMATKLMQAVHAQASLSEKQALSSSLTRMRSFDGRIDAAATSVRADLTLVRKALEKPVTVNEEP